MKRLSVMAAVASALVVGGCGLPDYNSRMAQYLEEKKEEQARDQYLEPAQKGDFEKLNVYLRPPKKAAEGGIAWGVPAGFFDKAATFVCSPDVPAAGADGTTPPPLPPLKLHVLIRKKPGKPTAAKGQPAPPPDPAIANRGDFIADVKASLVPEFGQEIAEKAVQTEGQLKTFKATAPNGDAVTVYFATANKGDLQAALIFDVPPALRNDKIVTKGMKYCVKAFALGAAALQQFEGKAGGTGAGAGGGGGAAF